MSNGPELWRAIYEPFANRFGPENVIIAGGCVRDYLVSKSTGKDIRPKDIDVFVKFDVPIDFEISIDTIASLPIFTENELDGFSILNDDPSEDGSRPLTNDTTQNDWIGQGAGWTFTSGDVADPRYLVNVVARRDVDGFHPDKFAESFDINACKGWYDPAKDDYVALDCAIKDIDNRTLTFGLSENLLTDSSYSRAVRIKRRLERHDAPQHLDWVLKGYDKYMTYSKQGFSLLKLTAHRPIRLVT